MLDRLIRLQAWARRALPPAFRNRHSVALLLGQAVMPSSHAGKLQVKVQSGLAARKALAVVGDIELIDGPNVVTTPLPIRADVSVVDGTTITVYPSPARRTEIMILDGPIVYVSRTPAP